MATTKTRSPRARAVKPETGARTPPRARAALDPDEARQKLDEQRAAEPADRAEPADPRDSIILRMLQASGFGREQWLAVLALPLDERIAAFDKAVHKAHKEGGRERFKAWCADRGATPKEMAERLSSDAELRVVRELDNATRDLMKVLNKLRILGLSAGTTAKWIMFHADLRWSYGDDDDPHELPTLQRFIESSLFVDSGLRFAGSDDARRKRKSDFKERIKALYDATTNKWPEIVRTKLTLALELLREAGDSPASRGDAEAMLEYMCTMLGLDVSRRNSRPT